MSVDNYQVPLSAISSADAFRVYLNAILANLVPGQGTSLPAEAEPEGRQFVVTGTNKLYIARSGSWVALT